jgi:quercetin dioxygenase-like cupin family protein
MSDQDGMGDQDGTTDQTARTARGGAYGSTGGSDERAARPMIAPLLHFSLATEIAALRAEGEYEGRDRSSRTLAKETDLRVLLSVLRAGATLDEQDGDARTSVQVVEGEATFRIEDDSIRMRPGEVAVVDRGQPWVLQAETDCAVLLTLAWPPEKVGV